MNATMLSILEKRKEDLRAAKALEEKKQRIEKSRQDIGHAVDIRERIRWIRRTSYTDSTDEVDSLDDIHWWPGIIYKDHGELMLDINKKNNLLRSFCFVQNRKNKSVGKFAPVAYLFGFTPPSGFSPSSVRNLSNFRWDSSKGDTFGSHHNGKVGTEVRNFFDCYESMETAVAASTVSQEMLIKYHEAVEVASEALLSDITPDQLAVACKELNAKENKDQSLVIYEKDMNLKTDNESKNNSKQVKAPTLQRKRIRRDDSCKEDGKDHKVKKISQQKISVNEETSMGKYDSWGEVWIKMKDLGWMWKKGNGLINFYYMKPNKTLEDVFGEDYFGDLDDVKKYARDTYGWIGGKEPSNEAANDDSQRKSKIKPISVGRNEAWATVWLKLQSIGWVLRSRKHKKKVVKSWYIKSDSTMQQGKRGRDYFTSDIAFKKYVCKRYGWIGEEKIIKKRKIVVRKRVPERSSREKEDVSNTHAPNHSSAFGSEQNTSVNEKKIVVRKRVPERSSREKEDISNAHARNHSSAFGSEQNTSVNDERLVHDDTEEITRFSANQFTWSSMWERLIELGWTYDKIRKYQYAVPGENFMLFERQEELIDYVRSHHGWILIKTKTGKSVKKNGVHVETLGQEKRESTSTVAKHYSKKKQKVSKDESAYLAPQWNSVEVGSVSDNHPSDHSQDSNSDDENLVNDDAEERECISWATMWRRLMKLGWTYDAKKKTTRYEYHMDGQKHLSFKSKSEIRNHAMHNYGWALLNPTPRKNTKRTKAVIQILDQGKRESPGIMMEDIQSKKKKQRLSKTTKNKKSSKIVKPKRNSNVSKRRGPVTPRNQKTRAQDPSLPLPTPSSEIGSCKSSDSYSFQVVWDRLKQAGWTYRKAGNKLHDWWYIRPRRNPSAPESKLGEDYFCSEGDVIEYQRKIDKESAEVISSKVYCQESVDSEGNDAESIKREPDNFTELWKRLKKADWSYQKVTKNKIHAWFFVRPGFDPNDPENVLGKEYFSSEDDVIQFQKYGCEESAVEKIPFCEKSIFQKEFEQEVSSQGSASLDPTDDSCVENDEILDDDSISCVSPEVEASPEIEKGWWQLEEVPIFKEAWSLLRKKLLFRYSTNYLLPNHVCVKRNKGGQLNTDYFEQAEDMRKYLCQNGIPMRAKDGSEKCLDEEDLELITRWVSLAHLPNTNEDLLSNILPLSNDAAWQLLESKLQYVCKDDKYYINSDFLQCGTDVIHGKHFFNTLEELRCYIRGHGILSSESRRDKVTQRMLLNEEFLAITLWASQSPLPKYNYLQHSQTHKTLSNHPLNKEHEHLQSTPSSLLQLKTLQNESSTKMLQNTSLSSINKSDTKEKMTLKETEDKVVSREKEIFAEKDEEKKLIRDVPQVIEWDNAQMNISEEAGAESGIKKKVEDKEIFAKKDDGNKSTCDIPQTIECDEAKINISQEVPVGDTESVQEKKEEMDHNALDIFSSPEQYNDGLF